MSEPSAAPGRLEAAVNSRASVRRRTVAAVTLSAIVFLGLAPIADKQLAPIMAFVAAYQTAVAITAGITAGLLVAQLTVTRSLGLLLVAAAYVFLALIVVVHALTFPGLVTPSGLFNADQHTTAWLYRFWHIGFALLIVAYAAIPRETLVETTHGIAAAAAGVVAAVTFSVWISTGDRDILPTVMAGDRYANAYNISIGVTWGSAAVALLSLWWWRRPFAALDYWLVVVLSAWLCDIGLGAVFNAGRWDLGFYAGRAYGFLASTYVMVMLLM